MKRRRNRHRHKVSPNTTAILTALASLPRIAAELGYLVAGHRDGRVEVLPGTPTTIIFSAANVQRGIFVLPLPEDQVRRLLHLPRHQPRDLQAELLWEIDRRHISEELPS